MKAKRIIISVIAVLAVIGAMAGCGSSEKAEPTNVEESSIVEKKPEISLDVDNAELVIGKTLKLEPSITNSDKGVEFTSSNPAIATVDANGNVKALKEGTCTITATLIEDTSIKAETTITCTAIKVSEIKASGVTLKEGKKAKIKATVNKDATNKTLIYKSSNPKIAVVDQKGNIKGIKEGSTTVKIMSKDGGAVTEVKIKVTNKYGIKHLTTPKTVYSNDVNFFKVPNTDDKNLIKYLPINTEIKVLGETPTWYLCKVGNQTGYVMRQYTSAKKVVLQQNYNNNTGNNNSYGGNSGGTNYNTNYNNNYSNNNNSNNNYSNNNNNYSNNNNSGGTASNNNTGGWELKTYDDVVVPNDGGPVSGSNPDAFGESHTWS